MDAVLHSDLKVIGLTGPKFMGKSTVAAHLVKHHGFTVLHFATPTKTMLKAVFGIDYDSLSATEKEAVHPDLGGNSPRRVLQTFGTEYLRHTLGEDLLVKMALRSLKEYGMKGRFVFDDLRFNNEAVMVKGLGGIVLTVTRRLKNPAPDSHSSESGIHSSFVDSNLDLNNKDARGKHFAAMIKTTLKTFSI